MFINRSDLRGLALSATAGASALVLLTACGADEGSMAEPGATSAPPATASPQSTVTVNDADVQFAQMMIPHHEQAVEMAKLAATQAADPEVKDLAAKIEAAQDPEIKTMTGWLSAWGKPAVPEGGHSGHSMPGMMTEEDMVKLQTARGTEFDELFAEMMIAHHQGAIQMAVEEQGYGKNPRAIELAKTIQTSQQAEIDQMEKLLQRL
ncbi:DUF305 domain-containing protein [Acrocarpospora macrocephala]|uniref:DUF305 domain-containing protein n=1 Tax=Acrocarpospora macrocephala TaxID=150177 RepID=A0A5M3X8Z6_9ACTN|nr:DUF305 domain-containing protein [Acrocarpospora macrocephala]GES15313.1 hypothetical protein Amac_089100 [Acrocarpospora macrocephala]